VCGKVYIGKIGRSIETRVKEHYRHIRLYHCQKSAVVERSINLCYRIKLQDASILAKKSRRTDRSVREPTEIELHPDNMNSEDGFFLLRSWKTIIRDVKERKQALTKNTTPYGRP
jgi:hypothetical protein